MAYSSAAKFFCKFESSVPVDERTGTPLVAHGDTPIVEAACGFGNGLRMSAKYHLSSSASLSITNQFTIGFWLKSVNPGMAKNGASLEPMRVSLLSKSGFGYSSGTGVTSLYNPAFVIWEETQSNGMNKLRVRLTGPTTTATVTSESYVVDKFHHFCIAYNGVTQDLSILIDGALVTKTISGNIPSSLSQTGANLEINNAVEGNSYNVARNTGVIDELFVTNTYEATPFRVSRAMTLGAEYLLDTSLSMVEETYITASVNDVGTIRVNAAISDNANLYVGRSDGKLLRGTRQLWRFNQSFASISERESVTERYGEKATFVDGKLSPSTTIRV